MRTSDSQIRRRRRRRAWTAAAAVLASTWAEAPARAAEPLQGAIFVLLDTVRADHLSLHGYRRPTSPSLERLAARGVAFDQAISSAPWTLPAVATMLAGVHVERALDLTGPAAQLSGSIVERIREAGYATGAFTEGAFVSAHYGFDRGFTDYTEQEATVRRNDMRDPDRPRRPRSPTTGSIEKTFARAGEWLRTHRNERFFLFVHTYEPHTPYERHAFTSGLDPGRVGTTFAIPRLIDLRAGRLTFRDSDLEYLKALYDGGILEADRHVGALLDLLDELSLTNRTLVVVTSDHGEELGEHYPRYVADHGHALTDTQLRVPLVISNPREKYAAKRVTSQVRLLDAMPTVAALLGVKLPDDLDGEPLLPLMRGEDAADRIAIGGSTKSGPKRSFVRTPRYKYIAVTGDGNRRPALRPPDVQLFDLEEDPGELTNLAEANPKVAERLASILAASGAGRATPEIGPVGDELREQLRALGYLE